MNRKTGFVIGGILVLLGFYFLSYAITVPESNTGIEFIEEGSRIMYLGTSFAFFFSAWYGCFRKKQVKIKTI